MKRSMTSPVHAVIRFALQRSRFLWHDSAGDPSGAVSADMANLYLQTWAAYQPTPMRRVTIDSAGWTTSVGPLCFHYNAAEGRLSAYAIVIANAEYYGPLLQPLSEGDLSYEISSAPWRSSEAPKSLWLRRDITAPIELGAFLLRTTALTELALRAREALVPALKELLTSDDPIILLEAAE